MTNLGIRIYGGTLLLSCYYNMYALLTSKRNNTLFYSERRNPSEPSDPSLMQ